MSTATKNIFGIAKENKPAASKKKDKESFQIDGIADKIRRFNELSEIFENTETELELIKSELKSHGKEKFIELFQEHKMKPESFKLSDEDVSVMFIAQDKYAKVETSKELQLSKFEGLVEYKKTFILNSAVLEKPGVMDAISEALMNCEILTDKDKENLLTVKSEQFVKKGTIERLTQYKDPAQIFELIQPVCLLKRC